MCKGVVIMHFIPHVSKKIPIENDTFSLYIVEIVFATHRPYNPMKLITKCQNRLGAMSSIAYLLFGEKPKSK